MFCCCQDDHSQHHQSTLPPTIQKLKQSHHQYEYSRNIQPQVLSIQQQNLRRKWLSTQRPLQSTVLSYKQSMLIKIESLRQQNRQKKISLTKKRLGMNQRWRVLDDKIGLLKTVYTEKELKMNDITSRVNLFVSSKPIYQQNVFV